MKLKELEDKCKKDMEDEQQELALDIIKESLKTVKSAELTLKRVKKNHDKLLNTDLDDLEFEDYEY